MKIVINKCYGGFGLSDAATAALRAHYAGLGIEWTGEYEVVRNDPALVAVVEELGEAANGEFASLKVVEIPEGVEWYISDYDGIEHVVERHRTWG